MIFGRMVVEKMSFQQSIFWHPVLAAQEVVPEVVFSGLLTLLRYSYFLLQTRLEIFRVQFCSADAQP